MIEPAEMVQLLQRCGLQTYLFKSNQGDELICKIRAPVTRLMTHADLSSYNMLLGRDELA